jgi:hypothetical protein
MVRVTAAAARDDAVEELHDEVHGAFVLAGLPQRDDAGAPEHEGHLPAHVLHVTGSACSLRLEMELQASSSLEPRSMHPELAAAQLSVFSSIPPLKSRPAPKAASSPLPLLP